MASSSGRQGGSHDGKARVVITRGSNVADAITSSGLLGGSVLRQGQEQSSSQMAATAAQLQRQIVKGSRASSARPRVSTVQARRSSLGEQPVRPQSAAYASESRTARGSGSRAPATDSQPPQLHTSSGNRSGRSPQSPLSSSTGGREVGGGGREPGKPPEVWTASEEAVADEAGLRDLEVLVEETEDGLQGDNSPTSTSPARAFAAEAKSILRQQELQNKLILATQEILRLKVSAEAAESALEEQRHRTAAFEAEVVGLSSAVRDVETRAGVAESAKRNAERRAKGLEAEVHQLRGQLEESRRQTDKLIEEASESHKHWERERAKHIDSAKKLRAEKKDEAKTAQANVESKLSELERTVDHLRRELSSRDSDVERLRQDLADQHSAVAAASEARRRLEVELMELRQWQTGTETPEAGITAGADQQQHHQQSYNEDVQAALTMELTSSAHIEEQKALLAEERVRSSDLANGLRKANRLLAEARERHAKALAQLEEQLAQLEGRHRDAVTSLATSLELLTERTAAMLAGRKPGSEGTKRRPVQGKPTAGKSTAMMVLEEMNEQLAEENALLLREVSKLQSLQHAAAVAAAAVSGAALRAASHEAVVMHKREILEEEAEEGGEQGEGSSGGHKDGSKAEAACMATEENLRLRMEVQTLQVEVADLKAALRVAGSNANVELDRARTQLLEASRQLDAAKRDRAVAEAEVEAMRATWASPEACEAEAAKLEAAKAALKAAKEDAQRKGNALSATKAEKQQRSEALEKEASTAAKLQRDVDELRDGIRRKDSQIQKLKSQLACETGSISSSIADSTLAERASRAGARPSSARPASGSGAPSGIVDYPRMKQQIAEKEAALHKLREEASSHSVELEKAQAALGKAKRQVKEKDASLKALEEDLRFTKETLSKQLEEQRAVAAAAEVAAGGSGKEAVELRQQLSSANKEAERTRIELDYLKQRTAADKDKDNAKPGGLVGKKSGKMQLSLCRAFSIDIKP
mmetsp:Transcript_28164/g.79540  ORF Transcript_28164/g.79540 Transcript_28164/m.79540 type:complete len:992 (+) Transcript_28164:173-3148(+)